MWLEAEKETGTAGTGKKQRGKGKAGSKKRGTRVTVKGKTETEAGSRGGKHCRLR